MPIRNLNASQKTKQTPAGQIPVDWEWMHVGRFCRLRSGGTPSRKRPDYWNGDIAWATTSEIKYGTIQNTRETITELGLKESSACLLDQGTVVMAMYGQGATRGRVALTGKTMAINQACLSITPKPGQATALFIYHRLTYDYVRLRSYSQGGNQNNLSGSLVASIGIPLPPLPEQRRIAEILSTWDRAIEQTEKLIEAKKRLKKGLMQQLLTGKLRFPQFREQETVPDEFPAGWQTLKAGELFVRSTERGGPDDPVLSVMQEGGVVRRDSIDRKITATEGSTNTYKLVRPGDFVISLRSFQGGLEYSPLRGKVSPAYHVICARKAIVDDFYRHFFKSYWFVGHLATAVIGIRDGKQVSFGDFEFLRLPYPPLEEQEQIAKALGASDANVQTLKMQLEALKRQKKGLMQKLLTGTIRVWDLH